MTKHKPVLQKEAIDALKVKPKGIYVDATLGGGGHALKIIEKFKGEGILLGIDLSANAINTFKEVLTIAGYEDKGEYFQSGKIKVYLENDNYGSLNSILSKHSLEKVSGVLADLGLSTDQIYEVPGVSYIGNSDLDMRLNPDLKVTASDLLNGLFKKEMINMFESLSDIDFAQALVKEIIAQRQVKPIKTTKDLKSIIQKVVPQKERRGTKKNPEAKVFQALRIAVNDELNSLRSFLPQALEALSQKGRFVTISFHSGEDRVVKRFMKDNLESGTVEVISKIVKPSPLEIKNNPRSASAKMRVISKI